jgi:hypothetical protein
LTESPLRLGVPAHVFQEGGQVVVDAGPVAPVAGRVREVGLQGGEEHQGPAVGLLGRVVPVQFLKDVPHAPLAPGQALAQGGVGAPLLDELLVEAQGFFQ